MRAGRLDLPVNLITSSSSGVPQTIDWAWCAIKGKDAGDLPAASGLRSPAKVEVRAWYDERLRQGLYLECEGRLLHIDSVRDFTGKKLEVVITATELIGQPAQYTASQGATPKPCRVHITHGVARIGEHTGRAEYWTQLEVALIEVGRPQAGAEFSVGADRYRVIGLVEDDDDRVTRKLWVKKL